MNLCRKHHTEVHQIGNNKFAGKYFEVKNWLIKNGWEFDLTKNKWVRYADVQNVEI